MKPPRHIELVEGLGGSLPAHEVVGAVRDARSASSLTRKLMALLFTTEEMATSSVRGKTKPPLDKQRMEAILGSACLMYILCSMYILILYPCRVLIEQVPYSNFRVSHPPGKRQTSRREEKVWSWVLCICCTLCCTSHSLLITSLEYLDHA